MGSNTPIKDDIDIDNMSESDIKNFSSNNNSLNNSSTKGCCQNKNCCNINNDPKECVSTTRENISKENNNNFEFNTEKIKYSV